MCEKRIMFVNILRDVEKKNKGKQRISQIFNRKPNYFHNYFVFTNKMKKKESLFANSVYWIFPVFWLKRKTVAKKYKNSRNSKNNVWIFLRFSSSFSLKNRKQKENSFIRVIFARSAHDKTKSPTLSFLCLSLCQAFNEK